MCLKRQSCGGAAAELYVDAVLIEQQRKGPVFTQRQAALQR